LHHDHLARDLKILSHSSDISQPLKRLLAGDVVLPSRVHPLFPRSPRLFGKEINGLSLHLFYFLLLFFFLLVPLFLFLLAPLLLRTLLSFLFFLASLFLFLLAALLFFSLLPLFAPIFLFFSFFVLDLL
jgi:hypothetical protein